MLDNIENRIFSTLISGNLVITRRTSDDIVKKIRIKTEKINKNYTTTNKK